MSKCANPVCTHDVVIPAKSFLRQRFCCSKACAAVAWEALPKDLEIVIAPLNMASPIDGLRPVMVTAIRAKGPGIGTERYEKGEAIFHAWGMASDDNGESYGPYSTAIVEFPDGTVGNVYAESIRFLDRT